MTVIYYTSNREDEVFEEKIRRTLLKNCPFPIISVSQKPIDFGINICVGEHDATVSNIKKQIYEGLKIAASEYVCMAEADFIYPPDYFEFEPTEELFYCIRNVYVCYKRIHRFYRKPVGSEGAAICHRRRLMEYMEPNLADEWDGYHRFPSIIKSELRKWVTLPNPVVTFKTGNGMHMRCPISRHEPLKELPYWGRHRKLRHEFF